MSAPPLRRAEASHVELRMSAQDRELKFELQDDGRGLEPDARGRGMDAMRARTQALGGQVRFETPPGGGTRLQLTLPLAPRARSAPPLAS